MFRKKDPHTDSELQTEFIFIHCINVTKSEVKVNMLIHNVSSMDSSEELSTLKCFPCRVLFLFDTEVRCLFSPNFTH